jgi:AcrR family transcriptional regulator
MQTCGPRVPLAGRKWCVAVRGDSKAKVLDAALKCFASKGYSATTIADIELVAGLKPGGGGTYRHFESKRAILEAVIDAAVGQDDETLAPAGMSLRGAARHTFAGLDRQRELLELVRRGLDEFPELQLKVLDRLVKGPYQIVANRITQLAPELDGEALATLMLGALIHFHSMESTPAAGELALVSRDRIIDAWALLFRRVIEPTGTPRDTKEV